MRTSFFLYVCRTAFFERTEACRSSFFFFRLFSGASHTIKTFYFYFSASGPVPAPGGSDTAGSYSGAKPKPSTGGGTLKRWLPINEAGPKFILERGVHLINWDDYDTNCRGEALLKAPINSLCRPYAEEDFFRKKFVLVASALFSLVRVTWYDLVGVLRLNN